MRNAASSYVKRTPLRIEGDIYTVSNLLKLVRDGSFRQSAFAENTLERFARAGNQAAVKALNELADERQS